MTIMKLNHDTINFATDYCTGKITYIDNPLLANIIDAYIDDANSSTLREAITANVCGYKWISEKLGFDAVDESTEEFKEIKPKRHSKGKFDGGGNFSDLTPKRIDQFKETESGMISSYFVDRRLGYVIEFSLFDIIDHIESQVYKKCVVDGNRYARSTGYNFRHWINSNKLKIHYLNLDLLKEKKCLNKEFEKLLEQKVNDRKLLEQKI